MGLFIFGAICGGVTMLFSGILIGAITVEEKDREIDYLKRQLYLQAKEESSEY